MSVVLLVLLLLLFSFHLITLSSLLSSSPCLHSISLLSRLLCSLFPFYRLRYSKFTTRTALVCIKTIPAFIINFERLLFLLLWSGPLCHAPLCHSPTTGPTSASHSQRQRRSIKAHAVLPLRPNLIVMEVIKLTPLLPRLPLPHPILLSPLLPQTIACKLCL